MNGMHTTRKEYCHGPLYLTRNGIYAKPSLISWARTMSGSRPRTSGRSKVHTAPARQHAKKTVSNKDIRGGA
jgi:hypothetical protein